MKYYQIKYNNAWNCLVKSQYDLKDFTEYIQRIGFAVGFEGWRKSEGGWVYNSLIEVAIPYHSVIEIKRIAEPEID